MFINYLRAHRASFVPKTSEELFAWAMVQVVVLWDQPCRIEGDTFSQYLVRSGVAIPDFILKRRFLIRLICFLCAIFAPRRPDLMGIFPNFKFSETAISQRRSDILHAIYNCWHYLHTGSYQYSLENKQVFAKVALENRLPAVPALSIEEARKLGGPFIVKDPNQDMGLGIQKIDSFDELLQIPSLESKLIQPVLTNHPDLNEILPPNTPLCTLRLLTTWVDGAPVCHIAYFRVGGGGEVVDNLSRGGTLIEVDLSTGRFLEGVTYPGLVGKISLDQAKLKSIPGAPAPFFERALPGFSESVELVIRAHRILANELASVGWDIALTPQGPYMIEANVFAGSYEILQFANSFKLGAQSMIQGIQFVKRRNS